MSEAKVQISIDTETLEEAMEIAAASVAAGADILEVGTPLLLGEGVHAIRAMREKYPDMPIVADVKVMDAGYAEAKMCAEAGADYICVMGVAHSATVAGCVKAGKETGIKVMADIMVMEDKVQAAKDMEAIGVDYICLHTGFDERHAEPEKNPLTDLEAVVEAVSIPVQAVGGMSIEQAVAASKLAPLVVIGAPLVIDDNHLGANADSTEELKKLIQKVAREVHGE